jgi:ribA/ribD-fused uncharacterized protein
MSAMPPRSVTELTSALAAGEPVGFLFFWGHRPSPNGVGKGCLSQWWPAPFTVGGDTFATAEHYMMWGKARLFGDDEIAGKVLSSADPKQVKALGRKVRDFDQAPWEANRYDIVVAGNRHKFGQHADLREFLLGTGDQVLVEASPVDRVWGIGMAADDPGASDPARWRGLNLLGFALGDVRAELSADSP